MNSDIEKTIVRIIQDYCFQLHISYLISEFALTIAPVVSSLILSNRLNHVSFINLCKKRGDFFIANNIEIKKFAPQLYKRLKHELSYYDFNHNLYESLVEYKRRIENGNLKGFPAKTTSEDTLRSNLAIYINYENFCEPRCGSGNCDIIIPSLQCIIETKLWHGIEYFKSGIVELSEYLKKQNYKAGYYIIYDYNINENELIKSHGQIFQTEIDSITVMFIRMADVPPSKKYIYQKKRSF